MATKVAQKRLQKEYLAMQKSPSPFIWACPEEKNILDWHFIIRGPPDTPYEGGEYHGLIWFPADYPFKPPDIKMFTPSGRFETGHKICMSMTSYHPSSWNAAWSVSTILMGLLSFMLSDEITAGGTKSTPEQKRALAKTSHAFNLNNKKFRDMFPTYATPEMTDLPDMGKQPSESGLRPPTDTSTPSSSVPSSLPSTTLPTPSPGTPAPPETAIQAGEVKRDDGAVQTVQIGQVGQVRHGGWLPGWRWVIGIVVLAVLGRVSTLAGIR